MTETDERIDDTAFDFANARPNPFLDRSPQTRSVVPKAGPASPRETGVTHSDPDRLGGTPVFVGTRVPVKALFDYLAGGYPLAVFLDHFPSVEREQAEAVIHWSRHCAETDARAS